MKMKKINSLAGVAAMMFAASASASTVSVITDVSSVAPGGTFTATIVADFTQLNTGVTGFTDGGFNLTWNTSQLTMIAGSNQVGTDLQAGFDTYDAANPTASFVFGRTTTNISTAGSLDFIFTNCGFVGISTVCETLGDTKTDFSIYQVGFTLADTATIGVGASLDAILSAGWVNDVTFLTDPAYEGVTVTVSAVPVPAAVWLFGSGLIGMVAVARRRKTQLV